MVILPLKKSTSKNLSKQMNNRSPVKEMTSPVIYGTVHRKVSKHKVHFDHNIYQHIKTKPLLPMEWFLWIELLFLFHLLLPLIALYLSSVQGKSLNDTTSKLYSCNSWIDSKVKL